jgi:hypothetical protein
MATILFLCATSRDTREILSLKLHSLHNFIFHSYGSDVLEAMTAPHMPIVEPFHDIQSEIKEILARCKGEHIGAVVSTDDYPGSTLASIVARYLGLPGVDPIVNLICQHKFYSRIEQKKFAPDAVPWYAQITEKAFESAQFRLPVFLKPVKSFFSVGAHRADTVDEVRRLVSKPGIHPRFFKPFADLLEMYADLPLGSQMIVEEFIPGTQVTAEGYVYQGRAQIIGIVDSIMYPGTISFERFDYPSSLSSTVKARMCDAAIAVMEGIGFDNGMFNIEFMYDVNTDSIKIIEINPRMASQFADLYEKVDGFNSYQIAIDLARGIEPSVSSGAGHHQMAASCVLRTFHDQDVLSVPSRSELERLQILYPDIRVEIYARVGARLSEQMQDEHSYRYGIISIGGGNLDQIREILKKCIENLTFSFMPCQEALSAKQNA